MPEYKKQHYVPKHLLRGWTDDEKLPVYNLDNQQEYPPTSLSNLCYEDYFYGGPEVEESMDGLENRHASIINKIRSSMSFDVLDSMDILHFCVFVLLQRNRTKQQKKETEDLIDNLAKEYLQLQVEAGVVDPELPSGRNALDLLEDFKITHEAPLAYPMLNALTGVDLIVDLEVAVLVNTTEEEFVISDHPVVHDNPRFKHEFDRFLAGVQSCGLQIFVPLSNNIQIMLYDPAAYTVDYSNEEKRRVVVTSEDVVVGLNDIQMISSFDNIYYSNEGQEQKYLEAQQRLSEYIETEYTVFRTLEPEEHDFDTENEILESGNQLPEYSPNLPFVNEKVRSRLKTARRPEVVESHGDYIDELLEDAREQVETTD